MESLSSGFGVLQRKMTPFAETVVFETLVAAQISLSCVITMTGLLLHDTQTMQNLIGNVQRFPLSELHKKASTEPEAKDGSDTEFDDEDADEPEDDAGDEDFSGDEKEEDDDDDEEDAELDPEANGNQGSDDEDNDDDEDDDDDNDEEEEEEEEEDEDDDETAQPPAKKRK